MEDLKTKAGNLTDSIGDYLQTYYKLKVLNAADKATSITASTVASLVVVFLGIFVLLFSGIALAIWLGHLLNSWALGYLVVAGLYLLVIIIIVALRKRLVFPMIRNSLIKKFYEPNNQDVPGSV
jgi:hypothetical protein